MKALRSGAMPGGAGFFWSSFLVHLLFVYVHCRLPQSRNECQKCLDAVKKNDHHGVFQLQALVSVFASSRALRAFPVSAGGLKGMSLDA